jgi:uncharacterized protein DUF5675
MSDVVLQREPSTDQGTKGLIVVPSKGSWPTLELPWLGNQPGISCVIAGVFYCDLLWSNHFKEMLYHILDVPGRAACEFHKGNWAGNVALGYHSNVRGCGLIGKSYGYIDPYPNQLALCEAGIGLEEFMKAMNGKPFTLEIRDAV